MTAPERPVQSKVDLIGNIVIAVVMLVIFVGAYLMAQKWPFAAGLFPLFITITGAALAVLFLIAAVVSVLRARGDRLPEAVPVPEHRPEPAAGETGDEMLSGAEEEDFGLEYAFGNATAAQWARTLGWLAAYFVGIWVLGVVITTAIVSFLYLRIEARAGAVAAVIYGVVLAGILWLSQEYLQLSLPTGLFGAL